MRRNPLGDFRVSGKDGIEINAGGRVCEDIEFTRNRFDSVEDSLFNFPAMARFPIEVVNPRGAD